MVHEVCLMLLMLVSFVAFDSAHSSPLYPANGMSGKDQADIVSFMMDYGYLPPKNPRLGEFRTKEELIRGIKQLQEFGGLKVTGTMNEETVNLIKKPRCSMPDFGPSDMMKRRKRYALHHSQWKKHDLTYRILNNAKEELTKAAVKTSLRKAFDMWSKVSPLTFKQIYEGNADMMISFEAGVHGDGYPFDGRGNKIAHGFYPHDNTSPEDGDVHFDDDEHWTLGDKDDVGTDFLWTAVHEIGHAIGVDHSTYWDAIMYPYYTGYRENLKLHNDDIMAIQAKYGKKQTISTPPSVDVLLKCEHPSPCDTEFDAVFHSNDGNTYFFKEPYFWTLDKYNTLLARKKIVDHWEGLKHRVQAAYTRLDGKTVFFKGTRYWVFDGTKRLEGPKKINEYGLPLEMKRLDAAFTWGGNGKTYFFKGDKYWRYNEQMKRIDPGYPKNISEGWGSVAYPISAVMTWSDRNTYFFNGLHFSKYEFRSWNMYKPQKTSEFFFKCQECDNAVQVARGGPNNNSVLKATVFAPLILLLTILSTLYNYW